MSGCYQNSLSPKCPHPKEMVLLLNASLLLVNLGLRLIGLGLEIQLGLGLLLGLDCVGSVFCHCGCKM